ncbi:L,D-transpeptidase family protein [Nonomuraea soli]|uniref:Lipoprotein-anchoring transpeptidase ErfK/SrfK n=1 Tax=Nonomuraea soli TaxID=1032476 RepID=A0A7W0CIA7_9ACTN|nr:L,D-transpeptidase family protein [Nonomuraea soli]MBA2891732.1 lipoprotein-anchoring transpeptidase ErfK/SrfK [Nonomuraea soli]
MIITDPDLLQVEQRLAEQRFDPGPVDGVRTRETTVALWGLQKLNGLRPTGRLTKATLRALERPREVRPLVKKGARNRVEVDLERQLMVVYTDGRPALISHVSTGANRTYCVRGRCGDAVTPVGAFRVYHRVGGWQNGWLGAMYKPIYFNNGIALHGSTKVPRRPASHGCVRVPLHTADRLFRLVKMDFPVYVDRSSTSG